MKKTFVSPGLILSAHTFTKEDWRDYKVYSKMLDHKNALNMYNASSNYHYWISW